MNKATFKSNLLLFFTIWFITLLTLYPHENNRVYGYDDSYEAIPTMINYKYAASYLFLTDAHYFEYPYNGYFSKAPPLFPTPSL